MRKYFFKAVINLYLKSFVNLRLVSSWNIFSTTWGAAFFYWNFALVWLLLLVMCLLCFVCAHTSLSYTPNCDTLKMTAAVKWRTWACYLRSIYLSNFLRFCWNFEHMKFRLNKCATILNIWDFCGKIEK